MKNCFLCGAVEHLCSWAVQFGQIHFDVLASCVPFSVSPYKPPRNLQTSEPTKTSFRVSWDPAPGDVRGYKVTFHPKENEVDLGELMVGPFDNTVVLEELRWGFSFSQKINNLRLFFNYQCLKKIISQLNVSCVIIFLLIIVLHYVI